VYLAFGHDEEIGDRKARRKWLGGCRPTACGGGGDDEALDRGAGMVPGVGLPWR
jgi:hypothetical protein